MTGGPYEIFHCYYLLLEINTSVQLVHEQTHNNVNIVHWPFMLFRWIDCKYWRTSVIIFPLHIFVNISIYVFTMTGKCCE